MITGKNYIGNTLSELGSTSFKTFNSELNKENNHIFKEASKEEIKQAILLATEAFKTYRNTSSKEKSAFLNSIAEEILALGDDLIQTAMEESGLPEGRLIGERGRTIGQLKMFANLLEEGSWVEAIIDTALPERTPAPRPDLRKMLVPIGPVVVFGASNFPFAFSTAGGDTASALASGCPVIVKSHPMHAGTGELMASAIIKAAHKTGMPNGVFSNLNSKGIEVGRQLVQDPLIKSVAFTGSFQGGKALFDLANSRQDPIPVFAEMGSINPVIVLPKILVDKKEELAEQLVNSITLGSGQFCTNPGLIIGLKSEDFDQFVQQLGKKVEGKTPAIMLHPHIVNNFDDKSQNILKEDHVVTVGKYNNMVNPNTGKQVIAKVSGKYFLENINLHQEVFGPFSLVVECENKEELAHVVNQLEGQLTGTIMGKEEELLDYKEIIDNLVEKVGRILYNGVPTGVEVCHAMHHGGPYPSTTDARFTSVGTSAIKRFVRPVCFQNWPQALLPEPLKNKNITHNIRLVNGRYTTEDIIIKT
ncbi:aldehyde dehydrogenase (NADP(+)) [Flavobacteriaceae bacterium UJ101]|nr:aldehyde dehydrogenase (NADP(+)) [Flavobacteriaceae bacterium UJ101]